MAKKKTRRERLSDSIEEIESALDELYKADQSLVSTQIDVAALQGNFWLHRRRIASIDVGDTNLSDQERTRARLNEIDFDKRQQEAQKQYASLIGKKQADLLPKLIARLEELDEMEGDLQALAGSR